MFQLIFPNNLEQKQATA